LVDDLHWVDGSEGFVETIIEALPGTRTLFLVNFRPEYHGGWIYEFSAQLTRMRALRETQGLQAKREIEAALAEADAWLEMSGAKSYEPFLHVERAGLARLRGDEATRERELREAHGLFIEIGAPIRAAEVARELES